MDTGRADDVLMLMWESHREHVRRLLLGLARDVDLAEDLLQETYLRAWRGVSSYRGGDARSWLSVIARNVFYSYIRQARIRADVPMDDDVFLGDTRHLGSHDHVEQLAIRSLVSELPDDLRSALLMKYHMGLTYREMARRMDCAHVTARARVSRAVSIVRAALDESWRPTGPICPGMSTRRILDFLYELLRPESMEAVEEHLRGCVWCREMVGAVRILIGGMIGSTSDYRMMHLVDVDESGVPSLCVTSASRDKMAGEAEVSFKALRIYGPCTLGVHGHRLSYDTTDAEDRPDLLEYTAELPDTAAGTGDKGIVMSFGKTPSRRARQTSPGTYRLDWSQCPSDTDRFEYAQAIRLPAGSQLLSSNPAPSEVSTGFGTTLIWRSSLSPSERFHSTLEYRLDS